MNQEREARLNWAVLGEKTSTGVAARRGEWKRPAASYTRSRDEPSARHSPVPYIHGRVLRKWTAAARPGRCRSQRFKSSIAHQFLPFSSFAFHSRILKYLYMG